MSPQISVPAYPACCTAIRHVLTPMPQAGKPRDTAWQDNGLQLAAESVRLAELTDN
jgi:hypothetical protein